MRCMIGAYLFFCLPLFSQRPAAPPKGHTPQMATLLSAVAPGAGQIYNRKYWKAPIVWGALGTTGYFLVSNHLEFIRFRDAFRERNEGINNPEFSFYQTDALRAERDLFQRNRDFMIILSAGVYLLNVIDATVDGHLYHFDVSEDLSFRWEPYYQPHAFVGPTAGLRLTLQFH